MLLSPKPESRHLQERLPHGRDRDRQDQYHDLKPEQGVDVCRNRNAKLVGKPCKGNKQADLGEEIAVEHQILLAPTAHNPAVARAILRRRSASLRPRTQACKTAAKKRGPLIFYPSLSCLTLAQGFSGRAPGIAVYLPCSQFFIAAVTLPTICQCDDASKEITADFIQRIRTVARRRDHCAGTKPPSRRLALALPVRKIQTHLLLPRSLP